MQAKMARRGEVTVVHLEGRLNLDVIAPFKHAIEKLGDEKIVFNLESLSFVGSTGITSFVETIEKFAGTNPYGTKLCGVGSEFRKIFDAGETHGLEIYESQISAETSYYHMEPIHSPEVPFPMAE